MSASPTPSLPPEDKAAAEELAKQLVARLNAMGKGDKRAPVVAVPPLPSLPIVEQPDGSAVATRPETETAGRGPDDALAVEREPNRESASPSSPPTGQTETEKGWDGHWRTGKGKDEGRRADLPLGRSGLPLPVKRRIVELFAHFQSVTEVQSVIEAEFELRVDTRWLRDYDADRPKHRLGKSLLAHFERCRDAYVQHSAKVAIAHQTHRLRLIGKLVEKAEKSKDFNAALKGLELAAKEMGGMMDASVAKKVEHSGVVAHAHLNVEDARQEVAMRLRQMVEAAPAAALPAPSPSQGIEDGEFSAIPEGDTGQGA